MLFFLSICGNSTMNEPEADDPASVLDRYFSSDRRNDFVDNDVSN